ncbi:DMT family transporter [Brevibacterium litoralis]|uniref:DMT family transporter n=1 Tax=Brevibacterium litoralis TaxID=3138935 RepID=UPI0032EC66D5
MIPAILLAVASAVALAYGALLQHAGAHSAPAPPDTTGRSGPARARAQVLSILGFLRRPVWLAGLLVLGLGTVANIAALSLAPVMVVQPAGALSLVISVLLGIFHRGLVADRRIVLAVLLCVGGVASFVAIAATIGSSRPHFGAEAHPAGYIALVLAAVAGLVFLVLRRVNQFALVVGAGVLFACVATNMHLVSTQFFAQGLGAVTWVNVAGLAAAGVLGTVFVQLAYASGPPETVIAGLTVIDPIVAVVLGSLLLGEAAGAPWAAVGAMILTGVVAGTGVVVLSRHHPDVTRSVDSEVPPVTGRPDDPTQEGTWPTRTV